MLSKHCDKYIAKHYPDLPSQFMETAIDTSITTKARLLHYFPMTEAQVQPSPSGGNMDSWCGLHIDHSILTGLTSAMYIDESDKSLTEVVKDSASDDLAKALDPAGLYIQGRGDQFVQVRFTASVRRTASIIIFTHYIRSRSHEIVSPSRSEKLLKWLLAVSLEQHLI